MSTIDKRELRHRIFVSSPLGKNEYGDVRHDAPRQVRAYVEEDLTITDEDVTTSHLVITDEPIGLQDLVWLPGRNPHSTSLGRRPKGVTAVPDAQSPTGEIHHYEITL